MTSGARSPALLCKPTTCCNKLTCLEFICHILKLLKLSGAVACDRGKRCDFRPGSAWGVCTQEQIKRSYGEGSSST
jgi:hypothetical protein